MDTSKLALCPSCDKPVYFQGANNVAACACGQVWFREGDSLTELDMRPVPAPADWIQPGTTGMWMGIAFTVTGRLRVIFEDVACNYWTLECNDGMTRHLSEGYGMYAVCEALPFKAAVIARKFKSEARTIYLPDDRELIVTARNRHHAMQVEGNAFTPAMPYRFISVEAASGEARVELIAYQEDVAVAYACHEVEPDRLFLQNTRDAEPQGTDFKCLHCHAQHHVSTYPYAQSWVCAQCQTRHSFTEGKFETHGANQNAEQEFAFETGERVTFDGNDYHVVGLAYKSDAESGTDFWHEYTLYSRIYGFAFLNESDGHWTFLKETRDAPNPTDRRLHRIQLDGRDYHRFSKYHFRILYAEGEFPGDVFTDHERVEAMDYVAPPAMLSVEEDAKLRITWFSGQYIPRRVITAQATRPVPRVIGIGPAQPPWIPVETGTLVKSAGIALMLAMLIQLFTGSTHSERVIFDRNYPLADSLVAQHFISEKFELDKRRSGLELDLRTPVENSWLEVSATLVNAVTGTEYSRQEVIEFYSGYDGGEHWSEGGQEGTIYFTQIPAGTYYLQLTTSRDSNLYTRPQVFTAKLTYDVSWYRNALIVVVLLLIGPLAMGIARRHYETTRWANSSYSKK